MLDNSRPRVLDDADAEVRAVDDVESPAQIVRATGPRGREILPNGAQVETEDLEDVRLAIVMAGGVSLCVWMGGVALEIDRARRRESIYDKILNLTRSTIRIDIISGTSAGGLNGTLLGAAITHGSTLNGLRQTWFDKADFEKLLRHPFDPDPPSLLKGDEFFLPEIAKVLEALRDNKSPEVSAAPAVADVAGTVAPELKVIATTSLIRGTGRLFFDDFGQLIPDVTHRGEFAFTGNSMLEREAHLRLAIAARSSAAHPGGFEASFAPVGEDIPAEKPIPKRPRMDDLTNWYSSRYTLDGGILVNRPLRPAIREILRQPADREVRRAVAFVVPDPSTSYEEVGDDIVKSKPTALETWMGAVNLSMKQTIGEELDALTGHNRRVEVQGVLRHRLFEFAQEDVLDLASRLYRSHQSIRRSQWAHRILDTIKVPLSLLVGNNADNWNKRAIVESIDEAAALTRGDQPFPSDDALAGSPDRRWDPQTVEGMILVVLDLATLALKVAPATDDDESAGTRAGLRWGRGHAHVMLREARVLQQKELNYWDSESRKASGNDATAWASEVVDAMPSEPETLGEMAWDTAQLFMQVRNLGASAARAAERADFSDPDQTDAIKLLEAATGTSPGDEGSPEYSRAVRSSLRFLLALEVVQASLLGYDQVSDQKIDFMQISANAPNQFDPRFTPKEKLTGLQLAHFGAFYKRSWKANDFMWGRLDGSFRLIQMLLSPHRLQRVAAAIDREVRIAQVADAIQRIALGDATQPNVHAYLQQNAESWYTNVVEELAFLTDDEASPPASLPHATAWIARRAQLEAVMEEIPHVAASLKNDQADLGNISREARAFLVRFDDVTCPEENGDQPTETPLEPDVAVELFKACDIGKESLADEFGSDKFTRISTTALAVGVKMLGGTRSGLGPVRTVFASMRAMALGIYIMARAALNSSKTASAVIISVLVIAGAALIMHYDEAINLDGLPFKIAWVAVASGIVIALLRGGARWGVLAIVLAIALMLGAASRIDDDTVRRITLVAGSTLGALIVTTILGPGFEGLLRLRVIIGIFLAAAIASAIFSLLFLPISFDVPGANLECSPPLGRASDELTPDPKVVLSKAEKTANKEVAVAACDELRDDWILRFALTQTLLLLVAALVWTKRRRRPARQVVVRT